MSWRANFRQHLLHIPLRLRSRITHPLRAPLSAWPGWLTVVLLLGALLGGGVWWTRTNSNPVHAALTTVMPTITVTATPPIEAGSAQVMTRVPTRRARLATTATPTATVTRSPTPTSSKLTGTPQPTATQIADSPLLALPEVLSTETLTPVVPLPVDHTGPQMVPVDVVTTSHTVSDTVSGAAPLTPSVAATATTDVMLLLVPTPTPTATPSIMEALEQPVGGLAGIAATATAAAPVSAEAIADVPAADVPATDDPAAFPTVSDVGAVGASAAPQPTVAIQPTPDGNVRTAQVPILMYHYLSVPPADADIYRLDLSVTPDLFAAHLDAMQQAGYTTISLYALVDNLTHGTPLPDKPVVLTFDDGYRDSYENAFPLLRARGMTATFFIVTDFINDGRPEYLTWDEVREMYAGGMSIEGHGRNHVSLANKDDDYLIWQALGTYESIQAEIGVRPHFISYPAGEYDQRTIDIFRSADYWAAVTTQQGATHSSDDLFRLTRVRIRGTTTPEELLRLLALDW